MEHLSHKALFSTLLFGIGTLMLFFFCAPAHADNTPVPTFRSTSPYRIGSTIDIPATKIDPNSIGHQTYRSTIYTPFGNGTPSSNNPSGNSGSGGSGDPDDDIGIPGWVDTPSEPLPIGDTLPLFLFAATMIAIIWIRQRKQQLTTQTQPTNNNDTTQHMTTRKQTYQSFFQKLFLLLAFVCIVSQVSGQTVYKTTLMSTKTPANFPKGAYGYQGAYANSLFYAARYMGAKVIYSISETTVTQNTVEHPTGYGTCCDDNGNLIVAHTQASINKFTIYKGGKLTDKTPIDLPSAIGNSNFISAKGNFFSTTESGYVYVFASGTKNVYIVEIKNGAYVQTHTKTVSITAPTGGGYIVPIEGANKFLYQARSDGFYLYEDSDKNIYMASGNTTQPNVNSTYGGITFKLGTQIMFVHPSGSNYNGGWTLRKMNANKDVVFSQSAIGNKGWGTNGAENGSCGQFFTVKRVDKYTVNLYEYCQANGIAAWTLRGSANKDVRIQTHDGNADGANKSANWGNNVNGGTIKFAYYANSTNTNSITTANIITGGYKYYTDVNPDKNITLTATPNSEYTFIGWWNNGATYTANSWTHVAKNSNQSITARFAKLKQQTINIHTYDTESKTYIANAIGGTVTVSYNNALTENNTSATLSSTSGSYKALINSTVTLTATHESGYVFVGWYKGNELWKTTKECSFKADNAYNITARFTKLVTQTFKVQTYESTAYTDGGNGGTMTVSYNDGTTETVTNSTSINNLYQGYNVTLTANSQTGYKFMGWFNNDFTEEYSEGSNTYTYRGEGTRTIYARFRKTYNQTVNISTYNPATGQYVSGGDGGIVTSVTYDDGNAQSLSDVTNSTFTPLVNTHVTVTAESKSGYKFNGWYSGETLLSKDAEYTYTVNAAKTITARFVKSDIQLVVAIMNYNTDYAEFVEYPHDNNTVTIANGGNTTTVTSSTSAIVNYGSQVTLTANNDDRDDGYDFIGWYQNNKRISQEKSYTFTITDHSAISAHFAPKQCHKVILYHTVGGQYQVKYARPELFDSENGYYVANSLYNKDTTIFVPYEAKLTIIASTAKPTIGYEYTGYRVWPDDGGKQNDGTYIINPGMTNGVKNIPQVFVGFVRTEEQVVYLDLSSSELRDGWADKQKYFICARNLATSPTIVDTIQLQQVKDKLYTTTLTGDKYSDVTFYYEGKDSEGKFKRISTTPFAIPATRFNCMKLNGAWNSVANGYVDVWTTLATENGDFRLIYREQTVEDKNTIRVDYEFNEGDRIKKRTTTGTDIVSLHIYNKVSGNVNGVNNPEVILQQWSDNEDAWVDVERYMVFGPLRSNDASVIKMPNRKNTANEVVRVDLGINNIMTDTTDNGCGVWNFVIEQDGTTARLLVDQTHRYEGDYFIRTSNADGQWYNYTIPASKMTYSEYAKKNSDFSHYFCRYIDLDETGITPQGAGSHKNVKFTVANRYAAFLCSELLINNTRFTDDEYEDDIFVNQESNGKTYEPSLPADATVRFGWDIITNRLTRAYIANTTIKNNEYLVIEGDKENNKIGNLIGDATYFTDNSNWLYSIDLPNAKAGATAKVKAKMNGQYQYFMGAQPDSQDEYETLISGSGEGTYPIRLLYDFKDDRFTTIYHPQGTISGATDLQTPVMIERKHNDAPTQITFETSATIKATGTGEDQYTKPAYAVMTFLEDKLLDNNVSKYEKMFYWISFPFDVRIKDVFGLGDYGKYWIMEEYDGAQRAQSGLAQTNWKYITKKSHVLKKDTGYVLCLNYNQILQDQLFTSHGAGEFGHSKLSLYFPSNSVISPAMLKGGQDVTRTLGRMENNATAWNHHNWHLIGVPSFATPGFESKQDDIPFLYQYWHPGDAYAAVTPNDVTFHAMHSFMVQYYGDIKWTSVVNTGTPLSIAAKKDADADKKVMLRLELQQAGSTLDKTYVQLRNDRGTKGFDMSLDLSKIINAGANIYSIVDNHEMAGNAIPKDETVLPLGVVITAAGDYTFAMPKGTEGIIVELIDYEQSTSTNLLMSDYTITLSKGTFNQRFALRLKPDKVATSVDNIGNGANGDEVRKLLIDGVLYLQKGNNTYDAQGKHVQ